MAQAPITLSDVKNLLPYCKTKRQKETLEAILEHGGHRAAARALGMSNGTVGDSVAKVKAYAAEKGWAPDQGLTHGAPDPFAVNRYTNHYDNDGEIKQQWVRYERGKQEQIEALTQAVQDAFSSVEPIKKIPAPRHSNKDLLVTYPMGDPHIGMYAWASESGDDFDLSIAEKNLVRATQQLVDLAPPAEQALICNLGDFFHSDSKDNRTLRSGHALDVDTRWAKVLEIGIRTMRSCIEAALTKHKRVHVINEIGNHDDHTAVVLTLALKLLYEKNPRVTFDDSPALYHYFSFGSCLIGVHHGDKAKPEQLGGIMATDKPQEWAGSTYRIWYTGHVHHRKVVELPGCMVESFRTLAPKDAWTAGMGYRSGRDMYACILHRKDGEIGRHRVDAMML